MSLGVAVLPPPRFSPADIAAMQAAGKFLAVAYRASVLVDIEDHAEDATDELCAALGQFATFTVGDRDDAQPLLTVQLTREPGRRFVWLGPDGHPKARGDDLLRLLHRAIRPLSRGRRGGPGGGYRRVVRGLRTEVERQ